MSPTFSHTPFQQFKRLLIHHIGSTKDMRRSVLLLKLSQDFLGDIHDGVPRSDRLAVEWNIENEMSLLQSIDLLNSGNITPRI